MGERTAGGPAPADWSPPAVEARTRAWLEASCVRGVAAVEAVFDPANRVFDGAGAPRRLTRYHFQALQRKLRVFRSLDRFRFASLIDVGSGWDHYPWLVGRRYGVPALYSDFVHEVNRPWDGSWGKLDRAVTLNVARLPFPDAAFDVVLCSEVLEHLVRPVEAIAELLRITRRYLVLTSLEALAPGRLARWWSHHRVDVRVPHVERNYFLLDELRALFGPDARTGNLVHGATLPASPFVPDAAQDAAYAAITTRAALVAALTRAVSVDAHQRGAMGLVVVKAMPGAEVAAPRDGADAALAAWLVDEAAAIERGVVDLLQRIGRGEAALVPAERPVAAGLLARLRCPDCGSALAGRGSGVACAACGAAFAGEYGVPILRPTRPADEAASQAAALDRLCGADRRRRRVVARVMGRLRRNERPPGALRRAAWRLEGR